MKKRSLIISISLLLLILFMLSGCFSTISRTDEYLDDSTRIATFGEGEDEFYKLEYVKGDNMYSIPFNIDYRESLDYLRANTHYGNKILTWWENGHMIQGYAKRQPTSFTPCPEILNTLPSNSWDESSLGLITDCNTLTNVAYAFLADSSTVIQGICDRQNYEWVYVAKIDRLRISGMIYLLGETREEYFDQEGLLSNNVMHKVLFQMTDARDVQGFTLMYADEMAAIYKRDIPIE